MSPRTAVVLLAAGSGTRVGAATNKVLLRLAGVPILGHSVRTVLELEAVHRLVVVIRPEDRGEVSAALAPLLGTHDLWLVDGGEQRHDSEWAALQTLRADIDSGDIEVVAIHDAARPLADGDLFRRVIDTAARTGSAVPALPAGPLSRPDGSAPRRDLVLVQTPQAFAAAPLLAAYEQAAVDRFVGTDTAACLEEYADLAIHAVAGSATNVKVTFAGDIALAEELLTASNG